MQKNNTSRWVLLRHTGAPEDLRGLHYDLLLEDKDCCRSWRLSEIPELDGPYVEAVSISPHKLYWLDLKQKVVSGNRGVATRVKKGFFPQSRNSIEKGFINLLLTWNDNQVVLVIDNKGCRIMSTKL